MHHCSVSQFRVCKLKLLKLSNGQWCSCAQFLYLLLFKGTVYLHCVVSWCLSFRENNDNYPFFFSPKPFCLKPADGSGYVAFFMNRGNPPNEGFCVTWVAIGFCNDSSSVQVRCQWSVGEMAPSGVTVISGWPCLHSCWAPVTPHSPSVCSSSTHAHMFMFRHRQMTKQMYNIHYMEEPNGCATRNDATDNNCLWNAWPILVVVVVVLDLVCVRILLCVGGS